MSRESDYLRRIARDARRPRESTHTVYLDTPLTSASYDGNDTVAPGTVTIDTSAVFGAPTGIKAAIVFLRGTWAAASASNYAALLYTGGSAAIGMIYAQVANMPQAAQITVPCDANGDFDLQVAGANMTNAVLRIVGYVL